jgi:hypothetical protein
LGVGGEPTTKQGVRVLNKHLFATASAGILLLSAVAASPQGLPYVLQSSTDQPSYINQLPSRVQSADQADASDPQQGQSADQADPSDPQRGRSAESRGSGPVSRRPLQNLQEGTGEGR